MAEQVDLSNFYPFLLHVKKFFEDDVNNRYREEAQEMASHLKNLYSAICSKYGMAAYDTYLNRVAMAYIV